MFFEQIKFVDGSMPRLHIAQVLAVSFVNADMVIRIISSSPSFVLPDFFVPEDQDPLAPIEQVAREKVQAYFFPSVPRLPFPPNYNPEVDELPAIPTQYISARYFRVGEKVAVIQNGLDYLVVGPIFQTFPVFRVGSLNVRFFSGHEIGHEAWLKLLDGAVFIERTNNEVAFLDKDQNIYEIKESEVFLESNFSLPLQRNVYQNYNLVQTITRNFQFPVFVFPRNPIVHLSGWTWASGAYNFAHAGTMLDSDGGGVSDVTISPSVLFPTDGAEIRLEVQPKDLPGEQWVDSLPDLEFYITGSDMSFNTDSRDFIGADENTELVLTIPRPWGTVGQNPLGWRTSNWVPPLMFFPDENNKTVYFGFVDYRKNEYPTSITYRDIYHNEYRFVTGAISAAVKEESIGKPILTTSDYEYFISHVISTEDSGYTLHIEDKGEDFGDYQEYTQTSTMNQPAVPGQSSAEPEQVFTVCSDGKHFFRKKPILKFIDKITEDPPNKHYVSTIALSIEHSIDNTLMFTSEFNTSDDGTVWNQRYYYLYSIDLANKIILAHVYIFDEPNVIQRVDGVVIDNGDEVVIWSYDRSASLDVTTPTNAPPWQLDDNFPDHPSDSNFIGENKFDHQEYIWKSPYFSNLNFPINTESNTECQVFSTIVAVPIGLYFPCTEYDEDIRSVVLFNTTHYDSVTAQGYVQQKPHNYVLKRRDGWIAKMRCCMSPDDGIIDYPFGSDIIIKDDGVLSDASNLYTDEPYEELKIY